MKLYFNAASPYVRKVRLLIREAGLESRVDEVQTAVSPVKANEDLALANPLMKIPTLVTDDGLALFDSPVICEYLDSLSGSRMLFPAPGPARWSALRQQAVADGILDAAILVRYEMAFRPKELHWPGWMDSQRLKWRQGLDFLEQDAGALGAEPTIGTLAVVATLGWLDFRYADDDWRVNRPNLAAWFASFSMRPSVLATQPSA
jgi:glutathione S-transferase